jgi:hypothetical protein
MKKKAKSKLSLPLFIIGLVVVMAATAAVKLATNPVWEIIFGILATIGVGLVALSKYV